MAKDLFHQIVKNALIKDGWQITDDPLFLRITAYDTFFQKELPTCVIQEYQIHLIVYNVVNEVIVQWLI